MTWQYNDNDTRNQVTEVALVEDIRIHLFLSQSIIKTLTQDHSK